jgi:hypothetical protein
MDQDRSVANIYIRVKYVWPHCGLTILFYAPNGAFHIIDSTSFMIKDGDGTNVQLSSKNWRKSTFDLGVGSATHNGRSGGGWPVMGVARATYYIYIYIFFIFFFQKVYF